MMAISVLLINSRVARICMLTIQITLFGAFIYYQKTPSIIPTLPSYRYYLTIILLLVILACTLEYFKTKQLQYITNLNKVNEQLRESNRVKERMLSILSHDFNAPVGNLASTLELFDDEILTEKQFKDISVKLKAQLQVLTISLGDVLLWSKMQIAGDEGKAGRVNIEDLLNETLPLFQHSFEEKKIRVQYDIKDGATAWVYKDDLKLIFRNLLSNALKFSHKGGIIFIDARADAGFITVSIKDEGTGMYPETLEALRNEQLQITSSPGTARERGTGLGLMLVREFLYKNKGTLAIYSALGKGSTFVITLPAKNNTAFK